MSLSDLINGLEPTDLLFKGVWDPEKLGEVEEREEAAQKKFYNELQMLFDYEMLNADY